MNEDTLTEPRLAVLAALHHGDAGLACRIVLGLMSDGHPFATILEEVVAPIQFESGRRWQVGDYSISEEHVSTAAAETLLATLAGSFDQPDDAPHVIVSCAIGETHTLPARMAAALLLAEGYRSTFLGSAVPADDLETYLLDCQPTALVVACTQVTNLLGAEAVVETAHRAGVPVIAGGRAFGTTNARAKAVGADAWAPSLLALAHLLSSWSPDPPVGSRHPAVAPDQAAALTALRPRAIESLTGDLAGDSPEQSSARTSRLAEEATRLFDTLVVTMHLNDPEMLVEYANWLMTYLPALGIENAPVHDILKALARAVDQAGPEVARFIDEATDNPTTETAPG